MVLSWGSCNTISSVRGRRLAAWLAAACVLVVPSAHAVAQTAPTAAPTAVPTAAAAAPAEPGADPNIVFILADDMSANQMQFMPRTQRLIFDRGASFTHYFTNVSICCPARASLYTGRYAHNTGIYTNGYPGGFYGYEERGLSARAFPKLLQDGGYSTALLGKFMNGYVADPDYPGTQYDPSYRSEGWTEWAVPFRGQYQGRRYDINVNGEILHKEAERDFLSDYLNRRATRLIRANTDGEGLMIELSDYGPHNPAPTSPIELADTGLRARAMSAVYPRTPAFNEADVRDKPDYIQRLPRLTRLQKQAIDQKWRQRALSLATLDRHVGEVWRAVRRTGQLDNTYFVFTSDNGYHLGEYRMAEGKSSEYDSDVRLPLGISGPGIAAGTVVDDLVGNIDLAPTFLDMAGVAPPAEMDGLSALPLVRRDPEAPTRELFLFQKGFARYAQPGEVGEPATRIAEKTDASVPRFLATAARGYRYVLYDGDSSAPTIDAEVNGRAFRAGAEAFYDIDADPHQIDNLAADPSRMTPVQQEMFSRMRDETQRLAGCRGAAECSLESGG